jgi:crotonobetainyl-CoA:carnitine CoA-transferase CaiB-like acyl-CoA transferase
MQPLAGIRVIEAAQMISAPMAGVILAEQGAEVIKIELDPRWLAPTGQSGHWFEPHRHSLSPPNHVCVAERMGRVIRNATQTW